MIPGGRRIKKYLYRMIFGIIVLPFAGIFLMWNEYKAILHTPIFQGIHDDWIHWAFRAGGWLVLLFCFQRIFSFAKLFMMQIPLTYNEIRTGIWIKAIFFSLATSLILISICWIYAKPMISLILIAVAITLLLMLIIRRRQQKKIEKATLPSVKPHQAKNV